ncbi:MAG TPA: hypothetical protein PLZ86_05545 [bacterium]|nr:hypothetical protein [bacterium]
MTKTFKIGALILLVASIAGCVWGSKAPPKTQLEIREFQTRAFDTKDHRLVMKAVLAVLQDDGYAIKNADKDLGFISASKDVDLGGAPFWIWGSGSKNNARWKKLRVLDATVNITEAGAQTRVRLSLQQKILDNLGGVINAGPVNDPKVYQDFFVKVDKGLFLQKENL